MLSKVHNCENCSSDFEYENILMPFGKVNNFNKARKDNIISCPCCRSLFNFVFNELNDFSYLEFIGYFVDSNSNFDYSKKDFLFQ